MLPPADTVTAMVEAYTPLARSEARKFEGRAPWLADDFLSDALLTLWRSAQHWREGPAGFGRYAGTNIRRALWNRLQRERRRNAAAFAPQVDPEFDPLALVAAAPEPERPERTHLDRLLAGLNTADRELVERRVFKGETLESLARGRGVSRQAVHNHLKRILHPLRSLALSEAL